VIGDYDCLVSCLICLFGKGNKHEGCASGCIMMDRLVWNKLTAFVIITDELPVLSVGSWQYTLGMIFICLKALSLP
jgi:hypothetical protein